MFIQRLAFDNVSLSFDGFVHSFMSELDIIFTTDINRFRGLRGQLDEQFVAFGILSGYIYGETRNEAKLYLQGHEISCVAK